MAYDSPKAAHFTAITIEGDAIPEHITLNLRWLVASKVECEFPDLLGIKLSDIPRIQEICEDYSAQNLKISFNVPAHLTYD